jgi:hypothetical protein
MTLLSPAPARAQDDVTISMARERFKEGVAYFDKKDFAKARVAFLQAYALKKHPAVLLNLAQSELRSGHEADAAKHFAQYLREHKEATESERQGAETGLTASKALVAEVALDIDTPGAEVYIDGDLEGLAPLPGPIYLEPGSHNIQAKKDTLAASKLMNATAGQSTSATLKLTAGGAKPVPPPAAGTPTPAPTPAPAKPTEATESAPPTSDEPAPAPEAPSHRKGFFPWLGSTPGAMVGVGLTGVGVIGGGAFAFGAKSAYNAADSIAGQIADKAVNTDGKASRSGASNAPAGWLAQSPIWKNADPAARADRASQYVQNCNKYRDNVKSGDTYKTLAIVSFGVAGAAALGTIIYYFADSSESAPASAQSQQRRFMVVPYYQPGFAGGVVSGNF